MDKILEKLNTLFEKNKEWHNDNWTTPGDKNPYPVKIQTAFIKHYCRYYKAEVSYETERDGKVTFTEDEDGLWFATSHAWFDCEDMQDCFSLLEYWVRDKHEAYLEEEDNYPVGEVVVRTIPKK